MRRTTSLTSIDFLLPEHRQRGHQVCSSQHSLYLSLLFCLVSKELFEGFKSSTSETGRVCSSQVKVVRVIKVCELNGAEY